jgi:hypothetical protein
VESRAALVTVAVAAGLALASCSPDKPTTSPTTSASTSTASTSAIAPQGSPSTTAPAPAVVLRSAGLSAAGDRWEFGAKGASVVASLRRAFANEAPKVRDLDCEAGPMQLYDWPTLTALEQAGNFVGWLAPQASTLRTDQGIGVGSTRADVVAAYPGVEVEESTLGVEWFVPVEKGGPLSGLLDGEASTSKVGSMWSGNACAFR